MEDKEDIEFLGDMEAMKKSEDLRYREDTGNAKAIENIEEFKNAQFCGHRGKGGGQMI